MLFKNIELSNFGRYKDRIFIDTSVSSDRNIILIKANNDRGKTTLFQAIKFVLYGESGIDNKLVNSWINLQSASEGDGEMYVEIKFEHTKNIYRLKRFIKFRKTEKGKEIDTVGNSVVDLFENDKPIMTSDSDLNKKDWIDTILPKDASQFFFFDGEEIKRYIQHEESHVKQAIEKVLGIKELLNSKEDLTEIYHRFQSEYDKNIRKHNKDEKAQLELEKLHLDIENAITNIKSTEKSIGGAQQRRTELDNDLKKHQAIKNIVEARNDAESKLSDLEKSLKFEEKTLSTNHGNLGLILSSPLLEIINKTEEDPPSIDRWQSETIKFIMTNHFHDCICGRPIDTAIRDMFHTKILDITQSKGSFLKKFVNNVLIDRAPAVKLTNLRTSLESVATHIQNIDKQKSILESLNHQIRSSENAESIKNLESKYEEIVKNIGKWENDLTIYKSKKEQLENQKNDLEAKIKSSVVDEHLQTAIQRKDMCDHVIDCMDQAINCFYNKRKPELEKHISQVFSLLTNNPDLYRELKIDRDFSMKVVRNDGAELSTYRYSPSAGASQIVATSMIAGLNKFATKDAPIIIDTPMGRLDPDHRKHLVNYYSKMGKQIIILYQPSELDDDDIQSIHDHIASEWEIDSIPDHPDLSSINRTESYL